MICNYDQNGRLISTTDAFGKTVKLTHSIADRTETVTDRMGNQTIHSYDTRGNVTSTTDAHGNTSYITYDDNNNELTTTNPLGNVTLYTYDSSNNRTSVTDALGNTSRFTYDSYGNQLTSTDPLGNTSTNTYDSKGNLLSSTNALGQTSSMEYDSNGNLTATYDALGNLTSSFGYDGSGNMINTTNAAGFLREFDYDANGNQTDTSYAWSDPAGILPDRTVTTQTEYNSAGQVTSIVDPEGNTTSTLYNEIGKPYQTTGKLGNITKTTYDDRGNIVETQYADGTVSRTAYDANGRGYITQDRHVLNTAANGSQVFYNAIGQVVRSERLSNVKITVTDNNGNISAVPDLTNSTQVSFSLTEYDRAGRVIKSTDAEGNISRTEYDVIGRTSAVIDALGNRTTYEYDIAGRQVLVRDALGRETKFEYDALGRRVRTIFADGTYTAVEYNILGQKIKQTDQSGISSEFSYDEFGRLAKVTKPPVDNGSGTLVSPVYSYSYDMYGRQTKITDPKLSETTFTYDALGRQLSRTLPMGQTESQTYNSLGQLATKTDFKGQTTKFTYDNYGRLEYKLFYATGASVASEIIHLTYDDLGRPNQIVKEVGGTTERETTYTYDSFSRVIKIVNPEGTINYEYDSLTGRKTKTYTAKSEQTYSYDELSRLKTVTVVKRNGQTLSTPEVTTYNYTVVGSRSSVELPNGVKTEYVYNNLNRLTKLTHFNTSNEILSSYEYTLAPNGHRTAVAEQSRTAAPALSPPYNRNITYQYDAMNRLVKEVSECDDTNQPELTYSSEYSYDLTGNRKNYSVTNDSVTTTINYTYNDNDQLETEISDANGTTTYNYDANGSLISKTGQDSSYTYTYNLQNRLSHAVIDRMENGNAVAITSDYTYNVGGIRVKANSIVNGAEQNRIFLLDSGFTGYSQVFEESATVGGDLTKSYTLGDDILTQSTDEGIKHFLYDGHGSTRLLADNTGTVTDSYTYDAYGIMLGGNPQSTVNQASTDILYSGEQFDNNLQMQYLRARYYNQNTGGFNRLDPFNGNMGDPQSLHKYAYCHGNPVNSIDPTGLAVYFVLRSFDDSSATKRWASFKAGSGHGYLLTTSFDDKNERNHNPLKSGYATRYTFSWHPSSWNYADGSGKGKYTRTPGRIWLNHPADLKPKNYEIYLITTNSYKQKALESTISSWIRGDKVGYEYGDPQAEPTNLKNEIGKIRHKSVPLHGGIYYSLFEQNCVWWATIMLLQNGISIPKDTEKVISKFNGGFGAANEVLSMKRSKYKVNYMDTLKPKPNTVGGKFIDLSTIISPIMF
ncbi:MAG: hypothetical protein L3J71_16235 [Victivallaceae bacterium]|nr:hypothetical protein [Victivallaceae bacterium]